MKSFLKKELWMTNKLPETFVEIRNYISLVEPGFFRYCSKDEEVWQEIIHNLYSQSPLFKEHVMENYLVEYVYDEGMDERESDDEYEQYEDVDCFYIIKIENVLYKVPGTYSSWNGVDLYFDQSHEVVLKNGSYEKV